MSLSISINNCLLHISLFPDASNHRSSKTSGKIPNFVGNALDGVTPYQNCSCRPVTSLKKVSVAYYRFLILKVVSKDYFCIRNLERFSQRIYWQYFLKLLICITKMTGKDNIQRNTNHKSNKKTSPKHYKCLSFYSQSLSLTGQHSNFGDYLHALFKPRQRNRQIATWLITIGWIKRPHEQENVERHLNKSKMVKIICPADITIILTIFDKKSQQQKKEIGLSSFMLTEPVFSD